MNGNTTYIRDPSATSEVRSFAFDHAYWSFDGYKDDDGYFKADPTHKNADKFSDQEVVFNDLGQGILENAWAGYNATLFAYGQTGSGKSYSVIGYGPNRGIVPKFSEKIFEGITTEQQQGKPVQFEVKFSMMEIYNEVVHDLLSDGSSGKSHRNGLKIRQHPKKGFFAEGLKHVLVTSSGDIERLMEQGTVNRTVASTNMNANSSRAHTIIGIHFTQKQRNAAGQETAKTSIVNIVDLAGSERAYSTGATGERLRECGSINKSLSCLSQCIFTLTEVASGQKMRVPFRDSALTRLLQNALMGNSKTVMIAALSPADINYEETLSTLRYADRAKRIKTKAVVNEDPTEKLIRELKEENERLRDQVASGNIDVGDTRGMSTEEIASIRKEIEEELKAQMLENEREAEDMKKTYEEKLRAAQLNGGAKRTVSASKDRERKPHIFNLNMDPQLTGHLVHILKKGATQLGNRHSKKNDFTIVGPGIQEQHAVMTLDEKTNSVNVKPCSSECRVLVNGAAIQGETTLCHNDRLLFGGTQMWVFANPVQAKKDNKKYPTINYEYAQAEIASKNGFSITNSVNADQAALQEDLLELLPGVEEANCISEELDERVKFELMLVSPHMMGRTAGRTEVCVKNRNLRNNAEYVWSKEKFRNRRYLMHEMFEKFEEGDDWKVPPEENPFLEPADTEVMIGTCQLVLQPLAFQVELNEQLELTNYRGYVVGVVNVEVAPCDSDGREYTEEDDQFLEHPNMLVGRDVNFAVKIVSVGGLPNIYTDVYCKYKLYLEDEHQTKKITDTTNPEFNDKKVFRFSTVTRQLADYLYNSTVGVQVWGRYQLRDISDTLKNLSTKEIMKTDRAIFNRTANLMGGFQLNGRLVDPQRQSIAVELLLMKKTQTRLLEKMRALRRMALYAEKLGHSTLSTALVLKMLDTNNPSQMEEYIQSIRGDQGSVDPQRRRMNSADSAVCVLA